MTGGAVWFKFFKKFRTFSPLPHNLEDMAITIEFKIQLTVLVFCIFLTYCLEHLDFNTKIKSFFIKNFLLRIINQQRYLIIEHLFTF